MVREAQVSESMVHTAPISRRKQIVLFLGIAVAAIAAARVAESLRMSGQEVVTSTWALWLVAAVTTMLAWIGARVGVRVRGRGTGVFLAAVFGAIAAVVANSALGFLWGLMIGALEVFGLAIPLAIGSLRAALLVVVGCTAGFYTRHLSFDSARSSLLLAGGIVACGSVLQLLVLTLPKRRWERFRVIRLLAATLVFGLLIGLSWVAGWRSALLYNLTEIAEWDDSWQDRWGEVLWTTLWREPVWRVATLRDPTDRTLAILGEVTVHVDSVVISGRSVDDQRIAEFPDLSSTRAVAIRDTRITGDVVPPQFRLRGLDWFQVADTPISDDGLLAMLSPAFDASTSPNIHVVLSETHVSGAGLAKLLRKGMPTTVAIRDSDWTDNDLVELSGMKFHVLELDCPKFTTKGLGELLKTPVRWLRIRLSSLSERDAELLAPLLSQGVFVEVGLPDAHCLPDIPLDVWSVVLSTPLRASDGEHLAAIRGPKMLYVRIDEDSPADDLVGPLKEVLQSGVEVVIELNAPQSSRSELERAHELRQEFSPIRFGRVHWILRD